MGWSMTIPSVTISVGDNYIPSPQGITLPAGYTIASLLMDLTNFGTNDLFTSTTQQSEDQGQTWQTVQLVYSSGGTRVNKWGTQTFSGLEYTLPPSYEQRLHRIVVNSPTENTASGKLELR